MHTDGANNGVRLLDLRHSSCRWPLGGAWDHAEFFCGAPAVPGCSWCKEHQKRAFARASTIPKANRTLMVLKDRRR